MPIKQVACSVCGQTVNKAQTYHVGNDKRACVSHEGVREKRDELEAKKLSDKQAKVQREEAQRREFRSPFADQPFDDLVKPRCWLCNTIGVRSQEFFMRLLINMEKVKQIYGVVNPFDSSHPANQHTIKDICIFLVPKAKVPGQVFQRLHWEFRDLVSMAEFMAICGPCAHRCNIEVLPKVELDQLATAGALYEAFGRPIVAAIAKKELVRDG